MLSPTFTVPPYRPDYLIHYFTPGAENELTKELILEWMQDIQSFLYLCDALQMNQCTGAVVGVLRKIADAARKMEWSVEDWLGKEFYAVVWETVPSREVDGRESEFVRLLDEVDPGWRKW